MAEILDKKTAKPSRPDNFGGNTPFGHSAIANTVTGALAGGAVGSVVGLIVPVVGSIIGSAVGFSLGAGISAIVENAHGHG